LRDLGWLAMKFSLRSKSDKLTGALARRLLAAMAMTLAWIAERLKMGSWTCVLNLLHEKIN